MKCCLALFGAEGQRLAQAMVWASCADVLSTSRVDMLSLNPAGSDEPAAALCAQYERVRAQLEGVPGSGTGFRTALTWGRWPQSLPREGTSLRAWSQENPADEGLLHAFFAAQVAEAEIPQGLNAFPDAAAAVWADLLGGEIRGALGQLLDEAEQQLRAGEQVRMLLCGSIANGMSAAGLRTMATYLTKRWEPWRGQASVAAVLLLPETLDDRQGAAIARAALKHGEWQQCCAAVYPLGLPEDSMSESLPDAAAPRLTDWLAVRCAVDFFTSAQVPQGMKAYRLPGGTFGWESFDQEAERFARGYGGLIKTAAAFHAVFTPTIAQCMTDPRWLHDRRIGWYSACFANAKRWPAQRREEVLASLNEIASLLDAAAAWMRRLLANLPLTLRAADALAAARQAAEDHYRQVLEAVGQIAVMELAARQSGMAEEKVVHRHDMEDNEAEQLQRAIGQWRDRLGRLEEEQKLLVRRLGGSAWLSLLRQTARGLAEESERLHGQMDEAVRRIDQASALAKPEEQYRVTAARTKLKRMEQHVMMVDARLDYVRRGMSDSNTQELRVQPPQLEVGGGAPSGGLLNAAALDTLFSPASGKNRTVGKRDAAALEDAWDNLVGRETDGLTLRRLLAALSSHAWHEDASPVAELLQQALCFTLKGEGA